MIVPSDRISGVGFEGSRGVLLLITQLLLHYSLTACECNIFVHSPAIVAGDANLETAGRRIVAGKFTNAGQFCLAPDYVLCMRDQQDKLVEVCKKTIQEFYGEVS